jgi:hypothetical protein
MMTLVCILIVLAALALLAVTAPIIRGTSTTIRWGIKSSGVVQEGGMSGAIVTRVAHEALGGAPTIIEDDAGFAAIMVLLVDGDKLTLTCIDDSIITWPAKGDWCSFKVPGQAATNVNFICIDNNSQLARKEAGTRGLVVEYHPNIVKP